MCFCSSRVGQGVHHAKQQQAQNTEQGDNTRTTHYSCYMVGGLEHF